jgi:multidrug efflux pump subunit AcrB
MVFSEISICASRLAQKTIPLPELPKDFNPRHVFSTPGPAFTQHKQGIVRVFTLTGFDSSYSEWAKQQCICTRQRPNDLTLIHIQTPQLSAQQRAAALGEPALPPKVEVAPPVSESLFELATKPGVYQPFANDPAKRVCYLAVRCATCSIDLKFNRPELNIEIDKDKAADLQVSTETIARTLQLNFSGQRFGYFTMNGKQYQVIGQVDRANRDAPEDVMRLYVSNDQGVPVPLENLVRLVEQSSPPQLYHYNRYMSATVSAGLNPGYTIKDGIDAMRSIASETLDDRFSTALTGASRDYEESSSNAWFALILALVLIYLVLAAQFESFRDPVVIMMTVPLAVAGALFSLSAFDQTINIFSQIGIIMLIGLVTKNGILIVEFANQLQRKGASFRDAIVEASALRLRPILMTSLATSLGALPIALALGAGSASRKGMGVVVVGGVLFSLVLTLFVIPAMYSYLSSSKKAHASD